jgi:TPR repeat protein
MGNSWALNKVGEYYRVVEKDLDKAYIYYKKAVESPIKERSEYAQNNLKKYYNE